VNGFYGQDYDDDGNLVYDPADPAALLEKAATVTDDGERSAAVGKAIRVIAAAGADALALDQARAFVKQKKLLSSISSFDAIVREVRGSETDRAEQTSVATALVELAQRFYTFGVSDTGETFALPIDGPQIVAMLRGGKTSLRALLAREYFTSAAGQRTRRHSLTRSSSLRAWPRTRKSPGSTCEQRSTTETSGSTLATTPAARCRSPAPAGQWRARDRSCSSAPP